MKNVFSLILIALSFGLLFAYIIPQYDSLSTLNATKANYESALASAHKLSTVRDALLANYNSISDADKANLAKMIPSTFDPVKLVSDISTDAAQYGMSISQVKIGTSAGAAAPSAVTVSPTASSTYQTYQVAFSTTGQYVSFVQFLKDIESSVQLLDLQKLTISSTQASKAGPEVLTFNVTLDTYATQ
jgi:Tfp pilus assembly protein PilO